MPRTRSCPSCGQMCLLGGFDHHVQQCAKKMARMETPCPYCDKMYACPFQSPDVAHLSVCIPGHFGLKLVFF